MYNTYVDRNFFLLFVVMNHSLGASFDSFMSDLGTHMKLSPSEASQPSIPKREIACLQLATGADEIGGGRV